MTVGVRVDEARRNTATGGVKGEFLKPATGWRIHPAAPSSALSEAPVLSCGSWVGLFVLALLMLAVPLAVGAQPVGKVARIGIFGDKAGDASEKHLWQVRDGLREHGWSEGANLVIEYRWAEGNAREWRPSPSSGIGRASLRREEVID